jgi:hypothetical protein
MLKHKLQIILIIQYYCAKPVKVLQYNISSQDLLELWNSVPAHEIFRDHQVDGRSLVWLLYIKAGCRKNFGFLL